MKLMDLARISSGPDDLLERIEEYSGGLQVQDFERIPTLVQKAQDTTYSLHGVAHDHGAIVLDTSLRNHISAVANKLTNAYFEHGFSKVFDVPGHMELNDRYGTVRVRRPQNPLQRLMHIPYTMFSIGLLTAHAYKDFIYHWSVHKEMQDGSWLTGRIADIDVEYEKKMKKKLKLDVLTESIDGHFEMIQDIMRTTPPMPLYAHAQQLQAHMEGYSGIKLSYGNIRHGTSSERSLYMARQLLKKDGEVHLFCGADHIPEVHYFLEHPDADIQTPVLGVLDYFGIEPTLF